MKQQQQQNYWTNNEQACRKQQQISHQTLHYYITNYILVERLISRKKKWFSVMKIKKMHMEFEEKKNYKKIQPKTKTKEIFINKWIDIIFVDNCVNGRCEERSINRKRNGTKRAQQLIKWAMDKKQRASTKRDADYL